MTSSVRTPDPRPRATPVSVAADRLRVTLEDGRELSVPLAWFALLRSAQPADQADVEVIEYGLGLWWERLDERISVPRLLGLPHH